MPPAPRKTASFGSPARESVRPPFRHRIFAIAKNCSGAFRRWCGLISPDLEYDEYIDAFQKDPRLLPLDRVPLPLPSPQSNGPHPRSLFVIRSLAQAPMLTHCFWTINFEFSSTVFEHVPASDESDRSPQAEHCFCFN